MHQAQLVRRSESVTFLGSFRGSEQNTKQPSRPAVARDRRASCIYGRQIIAATKDARPEWDERQPGIPTRSRSPGSTSRTTGAASVQERPAPRRVRGLYLGESQGVSVLDVDLDGFEKQSEWCQVTVSRHDPFLPPQHQGEMAMPLVGDRRTLGSREAGGRTNHSLIVSRQYEKAKL